MDRVSKWYIGVSTVLGGLLHVYILIDSAFLQTGMSAALAFAALEGWLYWLWPGMDAYGAPVGYAYLFIVGSLPWMVVGAIVGLGFCGLRLLLLFLVRKVTSA